MTGVQTCALPILIEAYPELPFFWFEFEHGGMGVFAINRSELVAYADELAARVN